MMRTQLGRELEGVPARGPEGKLKGKGGKVQVQGGHVLGAVKGQEEKALDLTS